MSRNSLLVAVLKFADANNIDIAMSQCQRLVRQALRSMEREEIRKVIRWSETTDDYKNLTYKDRTGEEAVRNIMRILNPGVRPTDR